MGFAVDWLGSLRLVSYGCLAKTSGTIGCGVGGCVIGALDAPGTGVDAD